MSAPQPAHDTMFVAIGVEGTHMNHTLEVAIYNTDFRNAHMRLGEASVHTRFVFGLSYGRTTDTKLEAAVDNANHHKSEPRR